MNSRTGRLLAACGSAFVMALAPGAFNKGPMSPYVAFAKSENAASKVKSSNHENKGRSQDVKEKNELEKPSFEKNDFKEKDESKSKKNLNKSQKNINDFDEIVSVKNNVAFVKKKEKFLFLIPLKIESQITLDDKGNVMNEKKTAISWLLEIFSF